MDKSRYLTAKPIFEAACNRPPEERSAYVRAACGEDEELRLFVEDMLATFEADETPSPSLHKAVERSITGEEGPGTIIDRFRLIEKVGEGGFGTVWKAEQQEPVQRLVAVKILKLGMDTRQVVSRFEAERQALALMDHTHIAQVHDGGATTTGRPYFAMELVHGVPIVEFCAEHRLDLRARLDLFTKVCSAIQHAHQKGIIHRDVKPSNVLVAVHDGAPHPKVIDFGIAKATNAELTRGTVLTQNHQIIGTPEYMAPEQVAGDGVDIDTRADVYSLGILLYELLTDSRPFELGDAMQRGLEQLLHTIRSESPPKPSTRVSSNTTQNKPRNEATRLQSALRGDLDWIVMRAIEKDRSDRYQTASALAADIARHLNNEPVSAGPPSASYRLRKFIARNRVAVVAGTLVFFALVAGLIGTGISLKWALAEKVRADQEAVRAEQRFGLALDAVADYHTGVAKDAVLRRADLTELRTRLLQAPKTFYERLRDSLSNAATPQQRQALTRALRGLAGVLGDVGDREGAIASYEQAIALLAKLANAGWQPVRCAHEQARLQGIKAALQTDAGQLQAADESFAASIATLHQLKGQQPDSLEFDNNLADAIAERGSLWRRMGRQDEAIASWQSAVEIYANLLARGVEVTDVSKDIADTHNAIGRLALNAGRAEDACAEFRAGLKLTQTLLDKAPRNLDLMRRVATCNNNLGNACKDAGDLTAAKAAYDRAIELEEAVYKEYPTIVDYRFALGNTHSAKAGTCMALDDPKAAATHFARALELLADPKALEHQRFAAQALQNAAGFAQENEEFELAAQRYEKAVAIYASLTPVGADPDVLSAAASCSNNYAGLINYLGQAREAKQHYQHAINLRERVLAAYPDSAEQQMNMATAHLNLARIRRDKDKDFAAACESYAGAMQALRTVDEATLQGKDKTRFWTLHRSSYWGRANAHQMADEFELAIADWLRAAQIDNGKMRAPYLTQMFGDMVRGKLAAAAATEVPQKLKKAGATLNDIRNITGAFLGNPESGTYSIVSVPLAREAVRRSKAGDSPHLWRDTHVLAQAQLASGAATEALKTQHRAMALAPKQLRQDLRKMLDDQLATIQRAIEK